MAIRSLVTAGFGNGTFNGTIALAVTRGYAIAAAVVIVTPGRRSYNIENDSRVATFGKDDRTLIVENDGRSRVIE